MSDIEYALKHSSFWGPGFLCNHVGFWEYNGPGEDGLRWRICGNCMRVEVEVKRNA